MKDRFRVETMLILDFWRHSAKSLALSLGLNWLYTAARSWVNRWNLAWVNDEGSEGAGFDSCRDSSKSKGMKFSQFELLISVIVDGVILENIY